MRRFYDSVKVLGMRDDKILEEFMDRGAKDLYGYIEDNEFKPFRVGKNMILAYEKMAEDFGVIDFLSKPIEWKVLSKMLDKYKNQTTSRTVVKRGAL